STATRASGSSARAWSAARRPASRDRAPGARSRGTDGLEQRAGQRAAGRADAGVVGREQLEQADEVLAGLVAVAARAAADRRHQPLERGLHGVGAHLDGLLRGHEPRVVGLFLGLGLAALALLRLPDAGHAVAQRVEQTRDPLA